MNDIFSPEFDKVLDSIRDIVSNHAKQRVTLGDLVIALTRKRLAEVGSTVYESERTINTVLDYVGLKERMTYANQYRRR